MGLSGPFSGRSITVVNDLSLDEQAYLYQKTREIKEAVASGSDTAKYRTGDQDLGIYLLFL